MGSTVLVVEDNPIFRATAIDMLETLGLKAFGAYSGESALGMIEAHPEIRLVFIDIRMPGMSGPDLAQRVRRRHPAMQIIMTSGYVAEDDAPPDFPFLAKPWRPDEIERTVAAASD